MHQIECNTGRQRRIGRPRQRHVAVIKATPQPRPQGADDDTPCPPAAVAAGHGTSHDPQAAPSLPRPSLTSSTSDAYDTPAALDVDIWPLDDAAGWPESPLVTSALIPSSVVMPPATPAPLSRSRPPIEHAGSLLRAPAPILYPQPTMEIVSASMATLSLMNIDLHNRLQVANAHRRIVDLDLLIYRQGPLFINNLTLAEFTLKVSGEYLSILTNVHSAVSRRKSLASTTPQHSSSCLTARASPGSLTTPMTLAMTSIFVQLLDLYELDIECLLSRLEIFKAEPTAPMSPPDALFPAYNAHPGVQGMLFVRAIHNLLQRLEVLLGISLSPERVGGLLSSRQMHTLWNEMSDDFGSSVTRPDSIKSSMREAISGFTSLLGMQGVHGLTA